MARGINRATIMGFLGKDPEIRYTSTGKPIARLSIATSEGWKDKQSGEIQERTEWHRIILFNRLAEIAGKYLQKGAQVFIEGTLRTEAYEDKNKIKRYNTQIIANNLQMIGGNNKNKQTDDPNASSNGNNTPQPNSANNNTQGSKSSYEESMPDFDAFDDDIPF